jgi:zinc protease
MIKAQFLTPLCLVMALLTGCAAGPAHLAAPAAKPDWAFAASDIAPDPVYRFGKLANGMRTVVASNATPQGTAMVRMVVQAGSLDEREDQRGLAHFVEHMAFEGSTHVREGEMIRLLQRDGLTFGADTNASTSFERTTYQLDLPRADPALLDTALMLMRETASELAFAPGAVDRERGVVLSEMREGHGATLSDWQDMAQFLYPRATYVHRLPIGTEQAVKAADAMALAAFWRAHYRPERTTLVVVGDFPVATIEAAIAAHFVDWRADPAPLPPRLDPGRVDPARGDKVDIHIDPALSERVTISRHGPWRDEPDTIANRRRALLRSIGYRIINRRFQSLARRLDPPFRSAGFGTSAVFHIGRTTSLVVDSHDGGWRKGLIAAAALLHQALAQGFTRAELDEQLATLRAGYENAAAEAQTRGNPVLLAGALALVNDDKVPASPADALARFDAFAPGVTAAAVLDALRADAVPLAAPLIRFQGRRAPAGGAPALRAAWSAGQLASAAAFTPVSASFAYGAFGPPGVVVADTRDAQLGIRRLRFANGVRLNLRHTDLDRDRIRVSLALAGGEALATRANPLAVAMVPMLAQGGLGKHSADDLQTLLAGHAVGGSLRPDGDAFVAQSTTTRRDLALECTYLAALITDPGYRPEAERVYHESIANLFARRDATPQAALGNALGGIVSDRDPRFSLADPAAYRALTFARLRHDIGDRLAHGAIEIGMVGDLDDDAAIAAVARSFGALPAREAEFRTDPAALERHFTAWRGPLAVWHKGPADQAIVRLEWPTADDHDERLELTLDLLQDIVTIAVEDSLRETMGKTYSPGARSVQSELWPGWGTFAVQAAVAPGDIAATRAAIRRTIAALIAAPADADLIARARAPLLQRIDNALKGNAGWLALVARAQSKPERIARHLAARALVEAITATDLQAAATRYLAPDRAVELLVVPEGEKTGGWPQSPVAARNAGGMMRR